METAPTVDPADGHEEEEEAEAAEKEQDVALTSGCVQLTFKTLSGEVFEEMIAERSWTVAFIVDKFARSRPLPIRRRYRLILDEHVLLGHELISLHMTSEKADLTVCIDAAGQIFAGEYFTVSLTELGIQQYGKRHADPSGILSPEPPGIHAHSVESISSGYRYAIALLTNGTLALWGSGDDGISSIPDFGHCRVKSLGHCLSMNRTGHAIVILDDGTVRCWGCNSHGQCEVPDFPAERKAVQVAGGEMHSVALLDDGSIQAWGVLRREPPEMIDRHVLAIDAARDKNIALLDDGSVLCFGYANALVDTSKLMTLMSGRPAVQVSAGCHNFLALLQDGDVVTIGARAHQMIDLTKLGGARVVGVAAGEWHCALLLDNGRVVGWGDNHGAYEPL